MQIACKANVLQHAVQLAESVISSRNMIPILQNIVFEAKNNEAKLSSSDLEETMIQKIPIEVIEPGNITIEAKTLGEILRLIPNDDEVYIKLESEKNIRITCKSESDTMWDLVGTSVSEYPKLPSISGNKSFSIDQLLLKRMIKKTIFAVSTENTRLILNGICFEIEKKKLKMAATDGRRLAFNQADLDIGFDFDKIIVPQKVLHELLRILSNEGQVKISVSEKQIAFEIDNVILISQLIEGEFPDYDQVIPKTQSYKVELKTKELMNKLSMVSVMVSDKVNRVIFSFTGNKLVLSSNDPDRGESRSEMPIAFDGEDKFEIAFQSKYMNDVLKVIEAENIIIGFTAPLSPATLKEVGNPDYVSIIMPMKII